MHPTENPFGLMTILAIAVADPGFPVGGHAPIRGVWTSVAGAFW